jgi:hypothetical protein
MRYTVVPDSILEESKSFDTLDEAERYGDSLRCGYRIVQSYGELPWYALW